MSTSALLIFALGWVACGVLSYGITLAYFQNEYSHLFDESEQDRFFGENVRFAISYSLFGPLSLLCSVLASGFVKHGLQYRRGKK